MNIRLLTNSDANSYCQLWKAALVEQDEFFRISIKNEPLPQIQTKLSHDSFTLGAEIDGQLLGTLSLERDSRAKLNHKALLFRIFVHPSASGQGVGKALILQAITLARKIDGLQQVYLTVLATNQRAIYLYKSMGFVTFALEPKSVKINNQFVDELQMVLFINS